MHDGGIRGVLEVMHITIYWRDARNAIVPAWHFDPTCSRADVCPLRVSHRSMVSLSPNGRVTSSKASFRGMIARKRTDSMFEFVAVLPRLYLT